MHFHLDEKERSKLLMFLSNHECQYYGKMNSNSGSIGGAITYSFTPTGLGVVVKVKCACGEEKDLTNYEEW